MPHPIKGIDFGLHDAHEDICHLLQKDHHYPGIIFPCLLAPLATQSFGSSLMLLRRLEEHSCDGVHSKWSNKN